MDLIAKNPGIEKELQSFLNVREKRVSTGSIGTSD